MNVSPSALTLISRPVFRPEMLPPTRCVPSNQFPDSESLVCMMLLLNSWRNSCAGINVDQHRPSHEGKFHEWTGTPQDKEIPVSKIKQGERSPDPAVRKEARFADNARHWNHKG